MLRTLLPTSRSRDLECVGTKESLQQPSFSVALRFWFKLGWISFGGTAAHIAIMHSELVEKKRWISNRSFLHALSHCMILPGPEAQQLAIYIGWKLHGSGIVAGILFVLPSMFFYCQIRQPAVDCRDVQRLETRCHRSGDRRPAESRQKGLEGTGASCRRGGVDTFVLAGISALVGSAKMG